MLSFENSNKNRSMKKKSCLLPLIAGKITPIAVASLALNLQLRYLKQIFR